MPGSSCPRHGGKRSSPFDWNSLKSGVLELDAVGIPGIDRPYTYLQVGLTTGQVTHAIPISGPGGAIDPDPRWPEEGREPGRGAISQDERRPDGAAPAEDRTTLHFEAPPKQWGAVLQQVARQLRLQIVSEEYTRLQPPFPFDPSRDQRLGA